MAVYCPMYDPEYGWYILVCGPNGFTKQSIISPLYYYYYMGVKPPVGSKFTQDDYDDFAEDIEFNYPFTPSPLPEPSWLPLSSPTMVPPSSTVSQTTAALQPKLGDNFSDLKSPLSLSSLVPVYSASLTTSASKVSASPTTSYHLDYLPPTPSGVGKVLPPIGTPCPHVASAATNSVKINENLMSPDIYDDPYLDDAMFLDEVDKSLLYQEDEDYEMSEYY